MRTNSRREIIRLALAGLTALPCLRPSSGFARPFPRIRGCRIDRGQLSAFSRYSRGFAAAGEKIAGSGDRNKDKALGRALVRISTHFGERPSFSFIDDSDGPNAYASPETEIGGTWGAVLFGINMFRDLDRRYDDQGMAILAVIAHEFAHVAQFHTGTDKYLLKKQETVKRVELHADFISGYYLGKLKQRNDNISLWSAGHTFHRIGDFEYNNQNHHGTPKERVAAAEAGFSQASDNGANFDTAFSKGIDYVLGTQ